MDYDTKGISPTDKQDEPENKQDEPAIFWDEDASHSIEIDGLTQIKTDIEGYIKDWEGEEGMKEIFGDNPPHTLLQEYEPQIDKESFYLHP